MTINVWDYLDEFEAERDDILSAVEQVFDSGRLVLGDAVTGFEREFADYHGLRHCVGVDNGTNAVKLALECTGVGPGDEVITVSNTAAPTVVAIVGAGATPTFVDIHPNSYLMDERQLEQALTEKTKAIVAVHLYGQCVDMDPVVAFAERHGLKVIEDCAQSHGATRNGRIAGSFGDAAAFSFYPTKVLGAYGDGGAVITDSDQYLESLKKLRYYGMAERYYVVQSVGHNSRLDEVQAAILRTKLRRLDGYVEARQQLAETYRTELAEFEGKGLVLPRPNPGNTHVYYVFVVRHPERTDVMALMREQGVNLNISYPWPIHMMSGYEYLGWPEGSLPVTEELADQIFSLPMYPHLGAERQGKVIEALATTLDKLG